MIYGCIYVEDSTVTNRQRAMTEAAITLYIYVYINVLKYIQHASKSTILPSNASQQYGSKHKHGAYSGELSH